MAKEIKQGSLIFLAAVLLYGCFAAQQKYFPGMHMDIPSIHLILEFFSIFISFSIALQGLTFYNPYAPYRIIVLSSVFFAVGVLDFLHVLTYEGLPLLSVHFSELSIYFTLISRLLEAGMLSILFFVPEKKRNYRELKQSSFTLILLIVILVIVFVFTYSPAFPSLYHDGSPTLFKYTAELFYFISHLMIVILGFIYYRKIKRIEALQLCISAFFLCLSSLAFTPFGKVHAGANFTAHILKIAGYIYYFKIVYSILSKQPYEKLKGLSNNYSRLLNSVVEGIFGLDSDGKVMFINESACRMLGFREDELIGRQIYLYIHHQSTSGMSRFGTSSRDGENRFFIDELFWRKDGTCFPVEFFTRPLYEKEEIIGTVVTFLDVTEKRNFEELLTEQVQLEYELEIAATVQENFLSAVKPLSKKYSLGVLSTPFKKLSGDFYNYIEKQDGLMISIADVCGKGVPAAIQMTMMKFAMEMHTEPNTILEKINHFFAKYNSDLTFITMFIGYYDEKTSLFTYSSAGHEPGLLYRARSRTFMELTTKNPLLGIDSEIIYKCNSVQLEDGDILILYTDGIIEKRKNVIDSNEILRECLMEIDLSMSAQNITHQLYQYIEKYHNGDAEDDQTLLVLKIED
ncbi:SpoIIE family protein phosphatase [Falsibacillus albus]|uniref:PAS domain S-box protein n=1 Tax=Falsibacillus albus TaxID=2478915 RepID=A0A3L7K2M6_9BACI|nr:SpoIIE family protein phosphatase [Falsibacillus albus]RLQ96599.1 PAS domain S-box protein [Falsibacillus albus]